MDSKSIIPLLFACGLAFAEPLQAQEPDSALAAISLDELLNLKISTAAKYEQTVSDAPASVTIVTAADLAAYGHETLEDVFKNIRGFYTSNDRNYGYAGVRGFSRPTDYNNRILILLNGHTLNDNVYDSTPIGTEFPLDLEAIERIEIVRGPGSALYGASAVFAVVNLITLPGQTIEGLQLSAGAGSYGTRRASALVGKEFANGVDFMASALWGDSDGQDLYYKEYDSPATNNGRAENLDWDKYYGLLATLEYKDLHLNVNFTSRQKGVPTGAYGFVFNAPAAKTLDEHGFIEIKQNRRFGNTKNLFLRGYYDQYKYAGVYPYEEGNARDWSIGRWLGGEAQFNWDPRPNHRLTFGLEYRRHLRADYSVKYAKIPATYGDFPFQVFSAYVQEEVQITPDLTFTLGMRHDGHSKVGNVMTPRAAMVYHPFRSGSLKLLYGEAFRAPSVWEAEAAGIDTEVNKPNRDLREEKIITKEIVWEQRLSAVFSGTISGYHYNMKNLIDTVSDSADGLLQYQNRSRVKASGLEVEINGRLPSEARGFASYSLQHARDAEANTVLTNSPRHLAKMGLIAPVFKNVQMAAELQYETKRRTVYQTNLPAYLLANFQVSTKVATKTRRDSQTRIGHFGAAFLVNNLLDVTYQTPGGVEHLQPGIAQNRRNYALKLQYKF